MRIGASTTDDIFLSETCLIGPAVGATERVSVRRTPDGVIRILSMGDSEIGAAIYPDFVEIWISKPKKRRPASDNVNRTW